MKLFPTGPVQVYFKQGFRWEPRFGFVQAMGTYLQQKGRQIRNCSFWVIRDGND